MVNKLTNTVKPLDEVDKINEIIDALDDVSVAVDNSTITKNASDQLQTVAVKDNRSGNAIKTWTGTKAQYDAIVSKDANTLYNITDDTDVTLPLLELLYPIGSIYIGTMANCPLAILGVGTWQLIAADKVLQSAGTIGSVGDTVAAGLPNITGQYASWRGVNGIDIGTTCGIASGAFWRTTGTQSHVMYDYDRTSNGTGALNFDASLSSSIYGNSSTVQPPAYIVNIWERIS